MENPALAAPGLCVAGAGVIMPARLNMLLGPGARLGPYEIVSLIGAGGMGEVYRARDPRLARDVAVKVLTVSAQDDEPLRRFEAEARAAGSLNHPHVLAVYDVGSHGSLRYVVSELLEGQTLRGRLEQGLVPVRKAIDLARQVAEGLAAAHARGIVHRDLKPENVFITKDGHLKILDFGLARLLGEGPAAPDAATFGVVLGTTGYMSPEQVRGEPADARSDIFSFGAVLYEMLSGRRAFKGPSAIETMNGILKTDPPELDTLQTGLPPGLLRIVWRCLEKSPEARFKSASDLAFHLETLSTASAPPVAASSGRGRRSLVLPLAAFAVGAAVVGLGAALWPRAAGVPRFERLTFRRGTIEAARFAPDRQTLVYGAAWAGAPVELFTGRVGSPEWRALGHTGTELLSISSRGELAVSLRRRRLGTFVGSGTLGRLPLAGGAPREVQEDIHEADWAPDGSDLAVVRSLAGQHRLEYPIGTALYQTAGWVSHVRFSPGGGHIAFVDHPVWGDDGGHIAVVDRAGDVRRLSRNWGSAQGLAWHPSGREVWFTATREGSARALHAVDLSGRERAVARMAGVLTLHDIAGDGQVLLSHHVVRREMAGRAPGADQERDLSWLDYSYPSDLSADGTTVFFAENGEGGGPGYGAYLRRGAGDAPAVRIGEGAAMALSPDGKWALANQDSNTDAPQLVLLPTGAGLAQRLARGGVNAQAADFFPDGRVLLTGSEAGKPVRTWVQDRDGGAPRALTAEGTRFNLATRPITPDGRSVLLRDAEGRWRLYAADGGAEAGPVAGLTPDDQPLRFTADGRHVYAYRPGEVPAQVVRLDPTTGTRVPWLELQPADRAGVLAVGPIQLTADGKSYVYGYRRVLSDLYVVSGLR
jgi:eukaryotic-like serine/threonine-protein kinase